MRARISMPVGRGVSDVIASMIAVFAHFGFPARGLAPYCRRSMFDGLSRASRGLFTRFGID
jgi:hypothetical protein